MPLSWLVGKLTRLLEAINQETDRLIRREEGAKIAYQTLIDDKKELQLKLEKIEGHYKDSIAQIQRQHAQLKEKDGALLASGHWYVKHQETQKELDKSRVYWYDRVQTLELQVAELTEVLKPFAKFSELAHIGYEYRQRMTITVPNPEATVPHRAETWLGSPQFKAAQTALTNTTQQAKAARNAIIQECADYVEEFSDNYNSDYSVAVRKAAEALQNLKK